MDESERLAPMIASATVGFPGEVDVLTKDAGRGKRRSSKPHAGPFKPQMFDPQGMRRCTARQMTVVSIVLGTDVPSSTVGNKGARCHIRELLGKQLTRIDSSYSRKLGRAKGPSDSRSGMDSTRGRAR